MKNISIRFLSVILTVAIVLVSLPLTVFASIQEDSSMYTGESDTSSLGSTDAYMYELTHRRDEYTKHFRNPDGTVTAIQYSVPLHRLSEDGLWEDIDNTIALSGNEYTTADARIKFAKKTTGNETLFTIHDGNGKITMSLDGANKKIEGEVTNYVTDEDAENIVKMSRLEKLNSSIIYRNILEGVDLEYVTVSSTIKENIILNSKRDSYEFTFTMKLNNMTATENSSGGISVYDNSNELVYKIAPPFMYDSNGVLSYNVFYTLVKNSNNEYKIKVTANKEWIESDERIFPITIDPSVSPADNNVTDLWVDSGYPNQNFSPLPSLQLTSTSKIYWKTTTLPNIPDYAYITSVDFSMLQSTGSENYIGIYRVTKDWTSALTYSSITSTVGTVDSSIIDYRKSKTATPQNMERMYWNVTDIVQKWANGTYPNYGLCLQFVSGSGVSGYVTFHSNNETDISKRPRLMITYKDQLGLEDYWSFASHSAGTAGNGYVNLATGNLVFEAGAFTTTDNLMPYTASVVYNSALSGRYYTASNRNVPNGYSPTGTGFKANMNQYIASDTRINLEGVEETYYIYTDADGTEHAFFKSTTSGENNIYYDEDGLKLKLTVSTDGFVIEDSAFNKYTFATLSSGGILKTITDVNGNSLDFTCDENGKPKSVKMTPNGSSSSITHFTITNNASGVLRYVLDSSRQQAVLFYYSNTYNGDISSSGYKYLRKIVYAHQSGSTSSSNWSSFYSSGTNSYITVDAECYYNYDSAGHIISVKDDLHKIEIAYTYDSAGRVTSVCEKAGSSSSVGQTAGFTYGTDYTKVRTSGKDDIYGNSDDIFTVYTFDHEGRCVSTYSTDINGYTIYGATSGEYVDDNEKAKNSIKTSSSISDIATNYLLNSNFEINGVSSLSYWTKSGNVEAVTLNYQNIDSPHSYNYHYYDSDYNVKITASSGATSSIAQKVALSSGTYTLSADLKNESKGTLTVRLRVISMDNSSTVHTEEVNFTNDYDYPVTAEATLTFNVSTTSTERFVISIEVVGESGVNTSSDFVWVRHATLSKSVGYSMNNRVNYGSFETSVLNGETSRYPLSNFWTSAGGSSNVITGVNGSLAGYSLYVPGAGIGNDSYVKQTIYTATSAEEAYFKQNPTRYGIIPQKLYRVSGRALSTNAIASKDSTFAVVVEVTYVSQDGTTNTAKHSFAFNNHIDSWQFVSGVFSTEYNKFVKKIEIYCQFKNQTGSACFDDISMCYIGGNDYPTIYDYDKNTGMLTEVISPFSRTCYEYDEDGINVKRKIDKKSVTDYTYDAQNRVIKIKYYSFGGDWAQEKCGYIEGTSTKRLRSTTDYEYNTYGLLETETVTPVDELTNQTPNITEKLVTTREYNTSTMKIFGALVEEIDALGNSTKYFYNSKYGYLLASIGPDGNGMTYTYDALGRMTLALPAVTSGSSYISAGPERVAYTYDDTDRLSTISRYGTLYSFLYDVFGNTTSISVGNHQLAGYTYNANNGKLATMTYGNGTSVKYDYDTLDRVEKIWYKENGESAYTLAYEYKYDSNGYLNTFYDHVNDNVTNYRYDSAGRLHEYYVNSASEDEKQSSLFYTYDADGRVIQRQYRQDYTYSGGSAEIGFYNSYVYDESDGSLKSSGAWFGNYQLGVSYTYDNLGRLTQKSQRLQHEHSSSASGVVTQQYEYTTRDSGTKLSLQISKMTSIVTGQSNKVYTYEYDGNGNITKISLGSVVQYAYQYDKLGQLVRVDDSVAGRTYVYYYNSLGNMQYKYTYPLGTTSGTPIETKSYGYGDSSWGDLLTHYNSVAMTYDTIGNPLTYYNGFTFSWKQGRRLATVVVRKRNWLLPMKHC